MRRFSRVSAGLVVAALSAACSGSSSAPPSSSSPVASSPPTSAPAPASTAPSPAAASCVPAFPATTALDTGTPSGGQLGLQAATAAVHPGYDRVVFTLGNTGVPGWRVEYVASPTSDASGNPVTVNGPSYLQVIIKNVGYPGDTGVPDPSVKRFSPSGTVVVHEVVLDTVFEGQATSFIGVSATLPFRVFKLASPPRVVVDVRHC